MATETAKDKIAKVLKQNRKSVSAHLRKVEKLKKDDSDTDAPDIDEVLAVIAVNDIANIEPELSDIGADANTTFLAQFGVKTDESLVGRINARANAYAAQRAGDLVTMIDESTRDMLRDDIASGLADNLSYSQIADQLSDAYAFSDDRAQLIATTEIRIANGEGNLAAMRQGVEAGLNLMKYWQADEDPCPECVENEEAGPIPIDDDFPSGDAVDPAHPHCECTVLSVEIRDDGSEDDGDE